MSNSNSLVSVIITTRNEEKNIENCLMSIALQSYKNMEIIVVDNDSTDQTRKTVGDLRLKIKDFKISLYNRGPERSAQRNFGAKKAKGEYLLFLDADMILEPKVIEECIKVVQSPEFRAQSSPVGGIIIPEKSIGKGFWGKVKAFERSFYVGDETIEAARFFEKNAFNNCGGYNENITGPEDWDMSQKIKKKYSLSRTKSFITHNEGDASLINFIKKKYYYGKGSSLYLKSYPLALTGKQAVYLFRPSFYRKWEKLVRRLDLTFGMIILLTFEQLAGFLGFLRSKLDVR